MPRLIRLLNCGASLLALSCLVTCKRTPPAAAGGTLVLSIDSTRPVDRVSLKVVDKEGNSAEFSFDTAGRDLTKQPATGEVVPGPAIKGGQVSFVGFGFSNIAATAIVSGRTEAEFQPGQRVNVRVSLTGDRVDEDQDGFIAKEDCNDKNSKMNPFLAEKCDNLVDDNCDGAIDKGCKCTNGQTRSCYAANDQTTRGLGECRDGVQTCVNEQWGDCAGSVAPNIQLCNGKDENCDGSVDEQCPCAAGTQRFCFLKNVTAPGAPVSSMTNPPHGECRAGTQRCVGGSWGKCEGATLPVTETCDGKDNDCDNVFDNGFDQDADNYTTCGTGTGCGMTIAVGGTSTGLIDCDDGNAARHPCQMDHCGDGNSDDDCDGSFNECQNPVGTCASAGFVAGWQDSGGRKQAECRYSGASYGTMCDPNTDLCMTATAQCAGVTTVGTTSAGTRPPCADAGGCVAGQVSPPNTSGVINAGTDPFDDCGATACDQTGTPVFAAFDVAANPSLFVAAGVGWVINSGMKQYECRVMDDVPANQTECNGTGACRDSTYVGRVFECRSNAPSALLSSTAGTHTFGTGAAVLGLSTPCRIPAPNSCMTSAAGGVTGPSSIVVANGVADPLQRCSENAAGCVNMVVSDWATAGDNDCRVVLSAPTGGINLCLNGACDTGVNPSNCSTGTISGPISCGSAQCRIVAACDSIGGDFLDPASTDRCYNANGGVKGTIASGGCTAGNTCFSSNPGSQVNDSVCTACNSDSICGRNCTQCSGNGATCQEGYQSDSSFDANASSVGTAHDCMCPLVNTGGNLTVGMACNGTCCPSNRACINGACAGAKPTTGRIACGNEGGDETNATCNSSTHFCNTNTVFTTAAGADVLRAPFLCDQAAAGRAACNQRECGPGESCTDLDKSTCSACSGVVCNHDCCASANEACTSFTNSTCTSCSTGPGCNTACCTTGQACTNFGASTCTTCASGPACNSACCGAGQACTNFGSGTCTTCASGPACNTACCGSGQACTNFNSSTCTTCSTGPACNSNCCTTNQACTNFNSSTCTTCSSGPACNTACCGAGQACTNFGAGTCTTCSSGPACNSACCGAGQACTDFSNSTCTTCPSGPACNTACCGAGQACTNSSTSTCTTCTIPEQACGSVCCSGTNRCSASPPTCESCIHNGHCGQSGAACSGVNRCGQTTGTGAACADFSCTDCTGGANPGISSGCGSGAACTGSPGTGVCQTGTATPQASSTPNALCANYACGASGTTGVSGNPGVHLSATGLPVTTCCGRHCTSCSAGKACNNGGTAGDFSDDFCDP